MVSWTDNWIKVDKVLKNLCAYVSYRVRGAKKKQISNFIAIQLLAPSTWQIVESNKLKDKTEAHETVRAENVMKGETKWKCERER